jgi:integrase
MSVQFDPLRERYVVRWYEDGRHRTRRFIDRDDATTFERSVTDRDTGASGDGVYRYRTRTAILWRFVFRRADGRLSSRRGFPTRAAAVAARQALLETIRHSDGSQEPERFDAFFQRLLSEKRAYLTAGAFEDLAAHGRKRLVPYFGDHDLAWIDEQSVRDWLGLMQADVRRGRLSAKTVNNARTWLTLVLSEAVRRGHMLRNPCKMVPPIPHVAPEIDYLHIVEIEDYLAACSEPYRPLAMLLIGTGAQISEALALTWPDVDLGRQVIQIHRQRSRTGDGVAPTKGKRSRSVHIGLSWPPPSAAYAETAASPGPTTVDGCSSARCRSAGATRGARSRLRRAARRSMTGTRPRSSAPAYATCHCTRSATRPPRPG